ncbi:MAG: DUF29 domain-containing protein, partial [Chroococcidiopsidaceae cyanobacterium CP_BM_RX_35]|nr:DUF29 domain-containing protein [Chroococcidiopsidaceae cyanobacterium CP_BM_RX_35]
MTNSNDSILAQELKHPSLYDTDFVLWTEKTADLLRSGAFSDVDWVNVIEEIESLGRSDKRALKSQTTRVIMHLLKWQYQPERRSNSWRGSIVEGRVQIRDLLFDSPSLKPYLNSIFATCYRDAVEQASAETGLQTEKFPNNCPYM